jgi:hypothetical protein
MQAPKPGDIIPDIQVVTDEGGEPVTLLVRCQHSTSSQGCRHGSRSGLHTCGVREHMRFCAVASCSKAAE